MGVVFQEQRLEMRQRVFLAKKAPYMLVSKWRAAVKLMLLNFCKL